MQVQQNTRTIPTRKIKVTSVTHKDEINPADLNSVLNNMAKTIQNRPLGETKLPKALDDVVEKLQNAGQEVNVSTLPPPPNAPLPPPIKKPSFSAPVIERPDVTAKSFAPRITNSVEKNLGKHAERVTFPSNGIFYPFTDATTRTFDVPDFAKIYKANTAKKDYMIIDIISNCLSVDARDLTQKDFRYLMYYQRINSFVRNPYKLTWQSFYGNENVITINNSTLDIVELDASREEYNEWLERGFCMPTVRDLEEFDNCKKDLDDEQLFYWTRAKYLRGENLAEKIAIAQTLDPDTFFVDTDAFVSKFEKYGVTEYIEVADEKFEAKKALEKLKAYVTENSQILSNQALSANLAEQILARLTATHEEIKRIEDSISNTGEAAPQRETISFSITLTDFFSVVQQ